MILLFRLFITSMLNIKSQVYREQVISANVRDNKKHTINIITTTYITETSCKPRADCLIESFLQTYELHTFFILILQIRLLEIM